MIPQVERPIDQTSKGSGKPTRQPPRHVRYPKDIETVLDTDLYRDRRVFYLPSERVFIGRRYVLSPGGRDYLRALARLLRRMPCRVVVSESSAPDGGEQVGVQRAWVIARYFTEESDLPEERINVAARPTAPDSRLRTGDVVEIALLSKDAMR